MCENIGSVHIELLYNTELRWFSRGETLIWLFKLRDELCIFFTDNLFNLQCRVTDKTWLF